MFLGTKLSFTCFFPLSPGIPEIALIDLIKSCIVDAAVFYIFFKIMIVVNYSYLYVGFKNSSAHWLGVSIVWLVICVTELLTFSMMP